MAMYIRNDIRCEVLDNISGSIDNILQGLCVKCICYCIDLL